MTEPAQHNRPIPLRKQLRVLHMDVSFSGGTYNVIRDVTSRTANRFDYALLYGNRIARSETALQTDFPSVELRQWPHAVREIQPLADLHALLEAISEIRRFRPDVIHLHSSKAGTLGRVAAAVTGCLPRTIFTPHGISFCQTTHPPNRQRLFRCIERTLASFGGVVVACSDSERDELLKVGVRSVLIRNGVARQMRMAELPKRNRPPWRVIAVGRIAAVKEPARFDAIARSFLSRSDVEFRWIGDGELSGQLTSPNIKLLGWRTKEEVYREMGDADVYCSASSSEGLSIAALEAMSFGLPVLLSDCVGNRDLVRAANGHLFSDVAEASQRLTQMLAMPTKLFGLGEGSKELVEREYGLDELVEQYSTLYEQRSIAQ